MGSGGSKKAAEQAAAAPAADGLYKITDPPENFVVEGLKCAGGVVSDHDDVREGKVVQVAKHPEGSMLQYWLKVEYGSGKIAFVHTLMSCGWNSDQVIRNVGDAQFPPDPKNLPKPKGDDQPPPKAKEEELPKPKEDDVASAKGDDPTGMEPPVDEAIYKIMDPPESFVVEGLAVNSRLRMDHPELCDAKVLQVAKHPEDRMLYWMKVEDSSGKISLVHTLMRCGWTYDKAILDVGDVSFPPDPKALPESHAGGGDGGEAAAVELPDLKPGDYVQEFVDPSHQDAIATDPKLKSVFPEASVGDVKSIWRGPTGFWLEVVGEPEMTRYGAHFLDSEETAGVGPYTITCAVKLASDEEFPPEPRSTRGKAVAFWVQLRIK